MEPSTDLASFDIDTLLADDDQNIVLSSSRHPQNNPYSNFIRRLGPGSKLTMRYALQEIATMLGAEDVPLEEIAWQKVERVHLYALVEKMRVHGYASKTCGLYLSALRGVFNEAKHLELISYDRLHSLREVKPFREQRLPTGKFVEEQDFHRLLADCVSDWRHQGLRDAAIISLLYGSGLRRAEGVAIDLHHLNQNEWFVTVIGKGNKELKKWIAPGAVKRIRAWLEVRNAAVGSEGPLFTRIRKGRTKVLTESAQVQTSPSSSAEHRVTPGLITDEGLTPQAIYYILDKRSKACGVKVKPHDLRRTFITRMIEKHGEGMAQKLADHANVATTLVYDMRGDKEKQKIMKGEDF
ncbi:site-specific integrase [Pseudomonas brenneri]|uniref:site-specific integrase n=1 Tax=Pseudomonas brenneri TaxID=129817 RepID=UPI003BA0EBBC